MQLVALSLTKDAQCRVRPGSYLEPRPQTHAIHGPASHHAHTCCACPGCCIKGCLQTRAAHCPASDQKASRHSVPWHPWPSRQVLRSSSSNQMRRIAHTDPIEASIQCYVPLLPASSHLAVPDMKRESSLWPRRAPAPTRNKRACGTVPVAPTRALHSSGRAARCPGQTPRRCLLDPMHRRRWAPCKGRGGPPQRTRHHPWPTGLLGRGRCTPVNRRCRARQGLCLISRPAARASTGLSPSLAHLMAEPYTRGYQRPS